MNQLSRAGFRAKHRWCFRLRLLHTIPNSWQPLCGLSHSRIMDPNTHCNTFRYDILCILTLITWKLQVVCRRSTYWTTVLLSNMSIFCVRVGREISMVSYASKHALQYLSDKPFVCIHAVVLRPNLKTSGHTWTFSISNDCYIIRDIFYVV